MPASSYRLEELLPHRPPMVLIDEIVSVDMSVREIAAAVTIRERWCENWAAIEFMAQTAAALVGHADRQADAAAPARVGFLLGTRRLKLAVPRFEVGRRYIVTARHVFGDDTTASFDCAMLDGETVVASAVLNAYRPPDINAFLETQRA